jgi:hypothetical protein
MPRPADELLAEIGRNWDAFKAGAPQPPAQQAARELIQGSYASSVSVSQIGSLVMVNISLADHMKVTGASLDNGLLHVDVVREVPEAAKPRIIKIGTAVETVQPQVTQQKAA